MTKIAENDDPASCRLHWSDALQKIAKRFRSSQRMLLASDFDGTLSPIVDHASDAWLHPDALMALGKIVSLNPSIQLAFLSGRSVEDLMPRLGSIARNSIMAGNHGLEIRGGGMDWNHPAIKNSRRMLDIVRSEIEEIIGNFCGAEVEDKTASLTLHYRRIAPSRLPEFNEQILELRLPQGIRLHRGKMVYEFRPAVEWNKGIALRSIIERMALTDESVIFMGDDVTDEDAFQILGDNAITIFVGALASPSSARFNCTDPADVASFLTEVSAVFQDRESSA